MVKMIATKCPTCGSQLEVREDTKVCFCTYCGTKMLLDDGNTIHTERIIDEARIAEAKAYETSKKTGLIMIALMIVFYIIMAFILRM